MSTVHTRLPETQEISLRLEHYDDIFSDFDIRPYSKRSLSSDFLEEIKRASLDKSDDLELILYVPEKERIPGEEPVIVERLINHFKKHYLLVKKEKRRVLTLGISMVTLGIAAMISATLIIFKNPAHSVGLSALLAFLEPAAWFLLWEGMDQIIFTSRSVQPELNFYRKMSNTEGRIIFETHDY